MKKKVVILLVIGIVQNGLSQLYFLNFSVGNSFNFDNLNHNEKSIPLSDNDNLRVVTNKNRLEFFSFSNLNLGFSINRKINEQNILELKFLNDYAYLNLYFNYTTAEPATANFINATNYSSKFAYSIYNLSFRYNLLLNSSDKSSGYLGIRTKLFLFSSIDVIMPSFNALLNHSGSIYGNDGISYYSANGQRKIDVTYNIMNINRVSVRPCLGLTLKVIRKNKHLFNFQTYWGLNSLQNLAEGTVKVYENNVLIKEEKYNLTTTAWYFNISRDFHFKKRSSSKKE